MGVLDRLLMVLVETEEILQMVPLPAEEEASPLAPTIFCTSSRRLLSRSRGARKALGSKPSRGNFTIF